MQLIRVGAAGSPAYIIGYFLSSWLAQGFLAISAFLGALGSFFSGSTTVSNLTFGDIQKVCGSPFSLLLLAAMPHTLKPTPATQFTRLNDRLISCLFAMLRCVSAQLSFDPPLCCNLRWLLSA